MYIIIKQTLACCHGSGVLGQLRRPAGSAAPRRLFCGEIGSIGMSRAGTTSRTLSATRSRICETVRPSRPICKKKKKKITLLNNLLINYVCAYENKIDYVYAEDEAKA